MDRGSLQRIDVTDGIESTLVMLGHKLRGGITVARDYDSDVPEIEAYAGELNQVWTNLIDNAVDAMDGEGTLAITTRRDGDVVLVEIADTGSGMAPAVVARAFEPFYTTKEVDKGTASGSTWPIRIGATAVTSTRLPRARVHNWRRTGCVVRAPGVRSGRRSLGVSR